MNVIFYAMGCSNIFPGPETGQEQGEHNTSKWYGVQVMPKQSGINFRSTPHSCHPAAFAKCGYYTLYIFKPQLVSTLNPIVGYHI
jgi:hypothetical protein